MQQPDIFEYADFRLYLDDWFVARKAAKPRYSHRMLSRKLGSSDPSLLVNIVKGRRKLAETSLDAFVEVLGLDAESAAYFRTLVRLGQATDDATRERAWGALAELRSRLRKPEINVDRLKYFGDMIYPAIRSLVACDGFQPSPEWIASHLYPPISAARAGDGFELLERLSFLAREGDQVRLTEEVVRTSSMVEQSGTWLYHAQTIDRSRALLEEVPTSPILEAETAFIGAMMEVPTERLGELRTLLYEHIQQIMAVCESWPERDRVVQLNMHMYPVTTSTRG